MSDPLVQELRKHVQRMSLRDRVEHSAVDHAVVSLDVPLSVHREIERDLGRAADALNAAHQREEVLSRTLEEVFEHVESAEDRIENNCALCYTYRAKIRAALAFGRADHDPAVPGLSEK